jgi:hypothetical protein
MLNVPSKIIDAVIQKMLRIDTSASDDDSRRR